MPTILMKKILHMKHLIGLILIETLVLIILNSNMEISDSFLSSLVSVTGILAGIIIAFLTTIFFNEKKNREKIKVELDELSFKLTTFRKILYNILITVDFWVEYNKILEFRRKYPQIEFSDLHSDDMTEEVKGFWLKGEYPTSGIDLYLAMRQIYGSDSPEYWLSDEKIKIDYSIEQLRSYTIPSNQIWYYLDGRFMKHGKGNFDDSKIPPYRLNLIQGSVSNISKEFMGCEVNRVLLAELGTKFHSDYLPDMIKLTSRLKSKVPKTVNQLFFFLTLMLFFGCIIPLFLMAFRFDYEKYYIMAVLVMFILGLYYTVGSIRDIMNSELR
jgi:hypothetical protein